MSDQAAEPEAQEEGFFQFQRREDGSCTFTVRPDKLVPEETQEHLRASGKEFLLAIRSLVDRAIQREEERESKAQGPRKIEVS
ncbi:MAG: hypothetical protein HYY02_10090 [Chloroflexi bacterium]|nr:hypothetical protein [Chloroflexota bacterium]